MSDGQSMIPPHGNYAELLSYQKAEVVYDLTFRFCERFLKKGDRTIDQMVQAARSGKQNIAEASKASGTSKETEIKLTNVARASLEELLLDYKDFLRVRDFIIWEKTSKEALYAASSAASPISPLSRIGLMQNPAPPKSWPTLRSASSTRPTIYSTSKSAGSKKILCSMAACASA
jgi:four helix bundle protein